MMHIIGVSLFLLWCLFLLGACLFSAALYQGGQGEANEASSVGKLGLRTAGGLLVVSLLLWWLL